MTNGLDEDKLLELRLTYTWDWFKHHAAQRFAAFNFFLIVVGAVIVAYSSAVSHRQTTLGVAVAGLGAVVGAGFLALDVRNGQLVELARAQLEVLEVGPLAVEITSKDKPKRKSLLSHSFWFRAMIGMFLALACAGAVWAALDFGGDATPAHRDRARHYGCNGQYTSPCSASFSSSYGTPTRR
ncbi:MAG: hypothetical protein ACLQBY_06395 [Solirubrobacteraceae bacterium]